MTFSEKLDSYKIIPRLMMLVMTLVYIRCIEWAMTQEAAEGLSTQAAGLISVVTGAATGSFAVWMGAESKVSSTNSKTSSKTEVEMEA